jgi:hypothetical protein
MIGLIKQFDNYLFLEKIFNAKKEAQLKPVARCRKRERS